jgi:iron complex outermembrane receptor protein
MNPQFLPPVHLTPLAIALVLAFAALPSAQAQSSDKTLPEVVVSVPRQSGERAGVASIGGFGDAPLLQTPASIGVISHEQMQDLQIRNTTDATRYDASVNEAYNAVGYAEQFSIRGYTLDNARSYRKDGLVIPGDAPIPLENKERIEILKGLAGLELGVAAPGGVINYVTKRPTADALRSVTLGLSERGTRFAALDVGGRAVDPRFGYRVNLATESLRSYVKGLDGARNLVAGAFDWQLTPQALLQLDLDYQYRSQVSQPGFQLIDGTNLPVGIDPATNLNNQPWSKPVTTRTSNVGLRFEYRFNSDWQTVVTANKHHFQRDDYAAFPYGCASANLFPGYCANGDYDVYDYQSANESKKLLASQALVTGKFNTAGVTHALTVGASTYSRRDYFGDCVYGTLDCDGSMANGTSNIWHPVVVPASTITTGPVTQRRSEDERGVFVQDVLGIAEHWKLHAGLRRSEIRREVFSQGAWLPNLALVYSPVGSVAVYTSYAQGLEAGAIAPLGTVNFNQQLDPNKSRQFEAGVKAEVNADLSMSMALFEIHKPLELANAANVFVRLGDNIHRGVEVAANGKVGENLKLIYSLAALDAKQQDTGNAGLDGKRVTDVPRLKSTTYLDYAVPEVVGLHLDGSWIYSGDKAFNTDNSVIVPAYHVFNAGLRYATRIAGVATTLRFNIDNVADKFYWRDVTPALGGYLYPGAPRLFRTSAQFDF